MNDLFASKQLKRFWKRECKAFGVVTPYRQWLRANAAPGATFYFSRDCRTLLRRK